jgi:hypothetical protein
MRNRILALVASLALVAGVGLAVATPAAAAPAAPAVATVTTLAPFASPAQILSFADCPVGQGCVWQNINGGGSRLNLPFSTYYGHCWNFTGSWNNAISSAEVGYGSGYGIRFSNDNCGFIGLTFDLNANKRVNFTDWWGWNDAVSSFQILYLP